MKNQIHLAISNCYSKDMDYIINNTDFKPNKDLENMEYNN